MKKSTFLLLGILISMSLVAQKKPLNAPTNLSVKKAASVNTVTDIDGNVYNTVVIGKQTWMVENLKTTKYRDGSAIPNVTDDTQWNGLTTGAYSDYNNTPSNSTTYGRLYNWYAVSDSRNIAPAGWHVPAEDEWKTLITYLGGDSLAGGKLKEVGTTHWMSPNSDATNVSGFTALPGGVRIVGGSFYNIGGIGRWLSTTTASDLARCLDVSNDFRPVYITNATKSFASSVRCIRDLLLVNAGANKSLICDSIVQLDSVTTNYVGAGTLKYKWTPSAGLNNDTIANPIAKVTIDTKYKVTVSLPDGSSASDSVYITVRPFEINSLMPVIDQSFTGLNSWPMGWGLHQTNSAMAYYTSKASWAISTNQLNFFASSTSASRGSTFYFPAQSDPTTVIDFDWFFSSATISYRNAFGLILDDSLSTNLDRRPILGLYMCGNDNMFHCWNLDVDTPSVFMNNGNFGKAGIDFAGTNELNKKTRLNFPYELGVWYNVKATLDFRNGRIRELIITKKSNNAFVRLTNIPFVDSRATKLSKIHVLNTRTIPSGETGENAFFSTSFDNFKITTSGSSKFVRETSIVCGGSTQLEPPKTNYTGTGLKYKWKPADGLSNDSIANPTVTISENKIYSVTITTPSGCSVNDIIQVIVNPLTVNAGVDNTFVCGTTSQLGVTTNYTGSGKLKYKWTPSEGLNNDTIQNPIVNTFKTINYTVSVTTPNGCTATDIVKVQPSVSLNQKIRLVGVDSNNKNMIVWNNVNPGFVDSVYIYKESDVTDIFTKIGSAPYSSTAFVDTSSNPKEKSNRYKITLKDKCGFETPASEPHKTMHLSINQGQSNTWNLILEPYDGFTVATYKIYRGTAPESLYLLTTMAGTSYQFSDYNPPLGNVYYQVEVVAPSTQFSNAPSQLRATNNVDAINYSTSRSNIATNNTTGLEGLITNNRLFTVFPNPAKEEVILSIENNSQATVKIYDLVGGLVKMKSVSVASAPINISDLPNALYVIEVKAGNKIGRQKLLVNK